MQNSTPNNLRHMCLYKIVPFLTLDSNKMSSAETITDSNLRKLERTPTHTLIDFCLWFHKRLKRPVPTHDKGKHAINFTSFHLNVVVAPPAPR